jgi:3-hydroxyacyl-CoA dehydrogenase/enoyl-CoA hydratase/3-hydroxybutyryl-CoA epimerase
MMDRFYFSQAIEAVRCLEEGVVTSVADANIGSIYGWGFPSFKGGVLQFINDYGLNAFKERALELSDKYGERFKLPNIIESMIKKDQIFQ